MQFSISIDFVYAQLNVKTVLFQTIQFSVKYQTVLFQAIQFSISTQFSSIWPIDRNLSTMAMKRCSAFPKAPALL